MAGGPARPVPRRDPAVSLRDPEQERRRDAAGGAARRLVVEGGPAFLAARRAAAAPLVCAQRGRWVLHRLGRKEVRRRAGCRFHPQFPRALPHRRTGGLVLPRETPLARKPDLHLSPMASGCLRRLAVALPPGLAGARR